MYSAEIRDSKNDVESAILCATVSEVARFYDEHGINFYGHGSPVTFKQYETGNIIARYTYTRQPCMTIFSADSQNTIASYPMIEGEGAPQYTFALPDEPTQLALL